MMKMIFLIFLIVITAFFIKHATPFENPIFKIIKCGQKLDEKRQKLAQIELKHEKCRLDINNLQNMIANHPSLYGDVVKNNCLILEELNKNIELVKSSSKDCKKMRRNKIKEFRDVFRGISNKEFKEILRKFGIED